MSIVSDTLLSYLPPDRKHTPSGWIAFSAPCCIHNGETRDTKQRGGIIQEGDTISYHCFNCGYKTSWQPGRQISYKMKKLLEWLHAPDDVINKLALAVLREYNNSEEVIHQLAIPKFEDRQLPENSIPVSSFTGDLTDDQIAVVQYINDRNLFLDDCEFYWSNKSGFKKRLIIPFKHHGKIVGWTARHVGNGKPKYMSEQQPGYVFGLDSQGYHKKFCLVVEGPVDALHIGGVALLGSDMKDTQALLIKQLNKDIFIVPDRDTAGKKLIEQAIDHGWGVSMPDWDDDINDVSDAVERYGRLYTLYSIARARETSPLKIRLRTKKWFI